MEPCLSSISGLTTIATSEMHKPTLSNVLCLPLSVLLLLLPLILAWGGLQTNKAGLPCPYLGKWAAGKGRHHDWKNILSRDKLQSFDLFPILPHNFFTSWNCLAIGLSVCSRANEREAEALALTMQSFWQCVGNHGLLLHIQKKTAVFLLSNDLYIEQNIISGY